VRAYFGLKQDDLAQYLGVTRAAVSHAETRRHDFGTDVWLRLQPLAGQLPPPAPAAPQATSAGLLAEAPAPVDVLIRQRLQACQREARPLRRSLEARDAKYQQARRWQRALPALRAALPPTPATDSRWQQRQRSWLDRHSADMADVLDAVAATEYRLLQLRLRLLDTEIAELQGWLAGTHGTNDPVLTADSAASSI
jgi:transcriptional regulator with XRE-family HTH domain